MHEPQLNLVQSEANEEKQLGTGVNWPQEIRDLFPFQLNVVEARNGLVTFRAPGISTNDSLTMRDFKMQLLNLTNVQDLEEPAFADLDVRGCIMGNAPITLTGSIDPNETDADVRHRSLDRRRAARRREPVAARVLESRRRDGRVLDVLGARGRRGPLRRLRAADPRGPEIPERQDEDGGPFRKAWEGLVNLAAKIFENKQEDQVATQIPLRGEITDPDVDVVTAIVNLLRNAFVAAFSHSLEGSINAARRRERRALPVRRAAGRRAARPRAIAAGAPPRSLLEQPTKLDLPRSVVVLIVAIPVVPARTQRPQRVRERVPRDARAERAGRGVGEPEVDAEQDARLDDFLGRIGDPAIQPRVRADRDRRPATALWISSGTKSVLKNSCSIVVNAPVSPFAPET